MENIKRTKEDREFGVFETDVGFYRPREDYIERTEEDKEFALFETSFRAYRIY